MNVYTRNAQPAMANKLVREMISKKIVPDSVSSAPALLFAYFGAANCLNDFATPPTPAHLL